MNEPRRLFDESTSPVERALLEAGSSYRTSVSTRDGTLAALGLAGSATLTVGAAGAASTSLLARLGAVKIIAIVTALGAVSAVPVGFYLTHHAASSDASHAAARPAAATPPRTVIEPTALPSTEEAVPTAAVPAPEAPATAARAARSEAKPTASAALAEEISSLDAARSALSRGDGAGALSLLDAYGREHPRGRLQLEAEVLRIDALAKSGRIAEAKEHARVFLQRHPNSVLASRVRATLDR